MSLAGAGWWWQSRTVVPNAALTAAVVAPVAAPKSIAILPLANLSDDKDTGFFADGVHEDFLTNFALVPELRVVSRTSMMQYRATTKTMKQIGEELGVAYVLVGSLRHAAGKIRVTGQLIDTRTDEHVRAKRFDRDLTDIFALLTELSSEIARALSAVISPQTQKFLARRPTETPAAYDAFPRARNLRNNPNTGSRPALRETEVLSKSAVQLDPAFAAAWGELAVVHAPDAFRAIDGSAGRLAQADAAIARAVRLAPEEPEVIRLLVTYAYIRLSRLRPRDGPLPKTRAVPAQRPCGFFLARLDPASAGPLGRVAGRSPPRRGALPGQRELCPQPAELAPLRPPLGRGPGYAEPDRRAAARAALRRILPGAGRVRGHGVVTGGRRFAGAPEPGAARCAAGNLVAQTMVFFPG